MKRVSGEFVLSASDLGNHLACNHATSLDLEVARNKRKAIHRTDPLLEVLRQRGFAHEEAYVKHLQDQGLRITHIAKDDRTAAAAAPETERAMKAGADVIVQAALAGGLWAGWADVLRRVATPSALGDWSYEVVDTKLTADTKAGTILQLCLYSELLAAVQGYLPRQFYVVTPGNFSETTTAYRFADFGAYYELVKQRLAARVAPEALVEPMASEVQTYPEPVTHCEVCRWWSDCSQRRRNDDHLSLVAGITRVQRRELTDHKVHTLEALAELPVPLPFRPQRGSVEALTRSREQARVQLEGKRQGKHLHEILPMNEQHGFLSLPQPDAGDLFLDLEGDPFIENGGREYLFGVAFKSANVTEYRSWWALTPEDEKRAFEELIDLVVERRKATPGMHVYHYAPYEPAAMKRLMGRYATREAEIDDFLRAGVFVDLYRVVRRALRASVEKYSIKDLEPLFGLVRDVDLREAGMQRRALELALETGCPEDISPEMRTSVEGYNRDDCVSALALRDWLETLRAGFEKESGPLARPTTGETPEVKPDSIDERTIQLKARLLHGVPVDAALRTPEQQARYLLGQLLEWHRREEKVVWWEFFRLCDMTDEELLDEREGLSGLVFQERVVAAGKRGGPTDRYRFVNQESGVSEGDTLKTTEGNTWGDVVSIDWAGLAIDIKKTKASAEVHPGAVFRHREFPAKPLKESLLRLGEWVEQHGMDAHGSYRAARNALLRCAPRELYDADPGDLSPDELPRLACKLGLGLAEEVLPIQGPPGAGKTHTGALMILELVRAKKRVGITAGSHEVIRTLLAKVDELAAGAGVTVRAMRKVTDDPEDWGIVTETKGADDILAGLHSGEVQIAAGTQWLWASPAFHEAVDVLFVDEAGQMSLANVLAAAQGGKSLVLLGDPQQLEQPKKGSHPDGADVSALEHLIGKQATIDAERGMFLGYTRRLSPAICAYTSKIFYDDRLAPLPGREKQMLVGKTVFAGAGLFYVPVVHHGNANESEEEVEMVGRILRELCGGTVAFYDAEGVRSPISQGSILVVTPYNAQISSLSKAFPQASIGTVDRFQGKEAPIVIYTLAASSVEEAPKGMEFLFNPNRTNVATSRAKSVCIVVASPKLFEPECKSPAQMKLANVLCAYKQMAKEVAPSAVRA